MRCEARLVKGVFSLKKTFGLWGVGHPMQLRLCIGRFIPRHAKRFWHLGQGELIEEGVAAAAGRCMG